MNLAGNQFLTFVLGSEVYGIEIVYVREILTYPKVTSLPNTVDYIKGIVNLRGAVTPILDLRLKFLTTDNPEYTDTTIVIAILDKDNNQFGLVVDSVSDIITIDNNQLLPAPTMGGAVNSKYLKGIIENDSKMILIMDTGNLLATEELAKLKEMA